MWAAVGGVGPVAVLLLMVAALVNAHQGHGCGKGGHQRGMNNTQCQLAASAAAAKPFFAAIAFGLLSYVVCIHAVETSRVPNFYKNGFFTEKM